MNGSGAFVLAVAVLVVLVATSVAAAVAFVAASRVSSRRPWLPYEDRPPVGLKKLRSADVSREVEAGLATWIGYLRRRTVQN
jgi:hypothetical protein